MLSEIAKAIIDAFTKTQIAPDSEEGYKAKNEMIRENTQKYSTTLMAEARAISGVIKKNEEKHGSNLEPSNIFNVFVYLRLTIVDLLTLNYYLAGEQNEDRVKFLLRSIALTIFELSEDVHHITGKEFRHSLRHLPNLLEISAELEKVGKEFKLFRKSHLSDLKEIRNVTIAHRDRKPVKQIETMDKLDIIAHGLLSWMVIVWFQDFKTVEDLIVKGFQEMRTAKNETVSKT